MNEAPTPLSVRELLAGDDYLIPMYQRNYAWGEGEIRQLIRDVIDYLPRDRTYHVGSLVVSERGRNGAKIYETIDGQQRLTTLTLLACYLKNETDENMEWYDRLRIRFESREHSTRTLEAIYHGALVNDEPESLKGTIINGAMLTGYRLIQQSLRAEWGESGRGEPLTAFVNFLLDRVHIMRVKVPDDTDLNHYFEIMNNRGEQLEKHEVLKSRLMDMLDRNSPEGEREANRHCIHAVWEACSDMERYVQMGFTPTQRNELFGNQDWGCFLPKDFDELRAGIIPKGFNAAGDRGGFTLLEIIDRPGPKVMDERANESPPERFNTVVNFQNFLLHVLRVITGRNVALDDKQLLEAFEEHVLNSDDAAASVKRFVHSMIRCKYLFDHYVLKREFLGGKDRWSLKRSKWRKAESGEGSASYVNTFSGAGDEESDEGINRQILMLLSAFHVSTPTMAYKYWLNAALNHLFGESELGREPEAKTYLRYLESVARAFVFDRYLAGGDYFEIIHVRGGACQTSRESLSIGGLTQRLTFPDVENFVFNFLDYLLWMREGAKDVNIRNWEFTFRSSVEHFYPQAPMEGLPSLSADTLHSFGNLCLISHSKNSRLSNFTPKAKKDLYPDGAFDSIKQRLMLNEPEWNAEAIRRHGREMIDLLASTIAGSS